ncbi:MAG: hypothetical protein WBQ89_06325 [Candidatus Acidiferrum sp.]
MDQNPFAQGKWAPGDLATEFLAHDYDTNERTISYLIEQTVNDPE